MKKKYIVDGQIYEVPDEESGAFIKDFPNAKISYTVEGKEYQIPHQEADAFEMDMGLKKKEQKVTPSVSPSSVTLSPSPAPKDRSAVADLLKPQEFPKPSSESVSSGLGLPKDEQLIRQRQVAEAPQRAEIQKQRVEKAKELAVNKLMVSKGLNIEDNSLKHYVEKERIQKHIDEGDLALEYDKNTNDYVLKRTTGFLETFGDSWGKAMKGNDEASAFVNDMDSQERIDHLNKQQEETNKEFPYEGKVPSKYAGSIGQFAGGNAPMLAKGAVAAGAGMAALALAPETMGASIAGLPTAMAFIATAPDMVNHGAMQEIERRYHKLKKQHPDWTDIQAMDEADDGKWAGGAAGLANATLLMTTGGNILRTPISEANKDLLSYAVKGTVNAATKMGATSTGVEAVKETEGLAEGIEASPQEIFANSIEAGKESFTLGAALHFTMLGVNKTLSMPPMVFNAVKKSIVDAAPIPEVAKVLEANEKAGNVPEGTTQKVTADLEGFKNAIEQVPQELPEEAKTAIAGLIQKKENLVKENAEPSEIQTVDNQISEITKTGKIDGIEFDNLTGEKFGEQPTTGEVNEPLPTNQEQSEGQGVEAGLPSSTESNSGTGTKTTASVLEENNLSLQGKTEINGELEKQLPNTLSPTEKQGSLAGGEENAIATAITGAIHRANQEAKIRGEGLLPEKIRGREEKVLRERAKEDGTWIDNNFGEPHANGMEQDVYLNPDGKSVTKIHSNITHDTWNDLFHRIAIHNALFPDVAYTLKGFTDHNGSFSAVFEQPLITKGGEPVRYSEVTSELGKLGFEPSESNKIANDKLPNVKTVDAEPDISFVNKKTGVKISDLHGENVMRGTDGKIHFIDPIIEIKNERELPNEETKAAEIPVGEKEGSTSNGGTNPPVENTSEGKTGDKFEKKGILNRLHTAEKVPEASKRGFEEKGLNYEPQTRQEAEQIGKAMVDEYGIDDAVTLAETNKFKGGVNSAIFADSLNRLYNEELNAKTPEAKLEAAKRFAEIGIRYDEFGRGSGRDISQIGHFYKKSPLGIKLMEEARRREDFAEFSKKKEETWKEFFDEMTKDPEFEKEFKGWVSEELKKERAEARAKRIKKVDDFFDDAIKKLDSGAAYSSFIPISPKVLKPVLEGMKKAYHGGEKVAKIIEDAIDYINKEVGGGWDKEAFRKEWEGKLDDHDAKMELPADKREKILERFRKKLKGLSETEKDEVIRRSFKKLVENGALEYADFKKIIADTLGYGEMSPEQAKKIVELVENINKVDDLATKVRETERNPKALKEYQDAKKEAEKSATELGKIVFNKPEIIKRLLSVMQLNTLGIPSLINNPIFNIVNQATVRLPRSVIMTAIDHAVYGAGKLFGKNIQPGNNVFVGQGEFFKKVGEGAKQSTEQLFSGLTNKDYFQKEVYASQIHPATSIKELWDWGIRGKLKLTKKQVLDKAIQGTVGVPAEAIARVLNIGDKPQRYATEGAQAATFAKNLGLIGIDKKLFMEFPKEEAYRKFKKDGMSEEAAMKKAEEIQDRIIKEGEESTFQENNLLNDAVTAAFKPFGKLGAVVKTLNMPFVKIPLNAFWSIYNLANPEVALLQSATYGLKALKTGSALDIQQSKKWLAHAVTGMAWMGVTGALAKAGIINAGNSDDTTKKEREGEQFYEQQNTVNMGKLLALMQGQDPNEVKDGLLVDTKWLGNMGVIMGYQATRLENMTPEQKETGQDYMEDLTSRLSVSALDFMDKGVFSNTGSMLKGIIKGGPWIDSYMVNLVNMVTNIIHPAAAAQLSRAQLPYYSKVKADTFIEEIKNSMATRSSFLRDLTGKYPPSKVSIWGDPLEKKDNWGMRLFGISRANDDNFAQPIFDDYKRTNNTKFFPNAVMPTIKVDDANVKLKVGEAAELETLVGQARKQLVAPYINDMAKFQGIRKKYSELTDDEKIDKLNILYEVGYQSGKYQFTLLHPEYKEKPLTVKQENKLDEKKDDNEELRDAAKEKVKLPQ